MSLEVIHRDSVTHRVRLLINNEEVSGLTIRDLKMRIGTSSILIGGIAGVYTRREYRMKGFSKKVINYAINWMHENNYPLSALFGIPNFYHKFGYVVFMGEHTLTILIRNAEEAEKRFKVELVEELDKEVLKAIATIYNENNEERTGTIVRDPEEWRGFSKGVGWEHKPIVHVVKNERGNIVGYLAYDPWQYGDTLNIAEIGSKNNDYKVFETIISFLVEKGIRGRYAYLTFYLPLDHPFTKFAIRYGYTMKSYYPKRAHGMARIICLKELFDKIKPELERRLIESKNKHKASVLIDTDIGSITLKIDESVLEVSEEPKANYRIKLSQSSLTQLVLGYRDIRDLAYKEAKVDSEVLPLLNILFPRSAPYVWPADRW